MKVKSSCTGAIGLKRKSRLTYFTVEPYKSLTVRDGSIEIASTFVESVPVVAAQTISVGLFVGPAKLID